MPVHAIKMTLQNDLARRLPRQAGATCRTSSCPGLSRLRGRSRFGAAKARASTFLVPRS